MQPSVRAFLIALFAFVAPMSVHADDCERPNYNITVPAVDCNNPNNPQPAPQAPAAAPDWSGNYTSYAAGTYRGTDSVTVNAAKKLHLKMTLKDSAGNIVNFNVPNLDIVDGHFSGNGKINGLNVTVEGRFDCPAPGQPWKIRFVCNYCDANGKAGRIIGIKDN
jgi:hypothetical protein